jgi:hypothetical protein
VAEKTKEAIEIECGNDKYVETGDGFDLGKEKFREKEVLQGEGNTRRHGFGCAMA